MSLHCPHGRWKMRTVHVHLPFPKGHILDSSKLKEFADENFDENGRKFLKPVENTEGKGEITRHKQFLLFPGVKKKKKKKTCTTDK